MNKQRIYISGQISGLCHKEAKARFKRAELALKIEFPSATIVNPMRFSLPMKMKWQWHMLWDLLRLSRCTHLYQLRGWQKSDGARIEYRWARHIGIKLIKNLYEYDNK